ncbi:MAG: glycosyltransferase [Thermodesulfobacteriota bacterium]
MNATRPRDNPLVSVVIPTYNRGWILREAIESVLSQDFKDFELIVVDDGSTDNTSDILSEYGDRIRVLFQRNSGVSAARNTGIKKGAGTYIAFLDSDDLWLPKKLSKQVDFFIKTPGARVCQTEEIWIRDGIRVNPKKKHKKSSGMFFNESLHLCLVSPSAVMIHRSIFDQIGLFDETLPACEDYDLWLRILSCCPVYLIDDPLIVKRGGHQDQLSRIPGLDRFRIRAIEKILNSPRLQEDQARAAASVLSEKSILYAKGCLKRGRLDEYRRYRMLASRYAPLFQGAGIKPSV